MPDDLEKDVRTAVTSAAKGSTNFSYARLAELGWTDLHEDEPRVAVTALFEQMGQLLVSGPALDLVAISAWGGGVDAASTRVLYPLPGRPGVVEQDGILAAVSLAGLDPEVKRVIVPVLRPSRVEVLTAPASACTATPTSGLDKSAGLYRVTLEMSACSTADGLEWEPAVASARRALAHQLMGVTRALLDIAVEHVKVREQFGRPLGANQAVQHRLADARVDLAAAEELTTEAWETPTWLAATVAKATASRAFESAAMHGQQVLGGIGYTWEHAWRHPLRRGMVLSVLLGAADECEAEIGTRLIDAGVQRLGQIVRAAS